MPVGARRKSHSSNYSSAISPTFNWRFNVEHDFGGHRGPPSTFGDVNSVVGSTQITAEHTNWCLARPFFVHPALNTKSFLPKIEARSGDRTSGAGSKLGTHDMYRVSVGRASVIALFALAFSFFVSPISANAGVSVHISRASQTMNVYVNGSHYYSWRISSGRRGYTTPSGSYRPTRLARKWYSRKYHWSPMPYSIFFRGGYAIHGTTETRRLGRRASHGCVRLHPSNARTLFGLVKKYGRSKTRIVVR